jgi:hypothetical protein
MKTLSRQPVSGPGLDPGTPKYEAGVLDHSTMTVGRRLFLESRGSTNGHYRELLQSPPPPPSVI